MASVAICPHCYLQLIVPDGVERDALVECPTCAKEFDLGQAVLRKIPEVVRVERARIAESEAKVVAAKVEAEIMAEAEQAAEAEVLADAKVEMDIIQQIQAEIEAGIAANGLHSGVREVLLPGEEEPAIVRLADTVRRPDTEPSSWFQPSHVETVATAEPESELAAELTEVAPADEVVEVVEVAELVEMDELVVESELLDSESHAAEPADVPEPAGPRPRSTTLADLLPPRRELDEPQHGPSFELPNVPLTPSNSATIEIDPDMSFGLVAETEFELEDVDFDAPPTEDIAPAANEPVYEEPVHNESASRREPAAAFVTPLPPRTKRKRSAAGTLVKVALGGVVGLSLGYLVLLYAGGPEGDIFHVAEYLPSVVLPASMKSSPPIVAETTEPQPLPAHVAAEEPAHQPAEPESENVPAGYQETTAAPAPLASNVGDEANASDTADESDRYAETPAPLDEPTATPIAAAPAAPVLSGPTYTVDQLKSSLAAGEEAKAGLLTGDLSDAAVRRTKGMSYATLCDLAQALVFVDREAPSDERDQLHQQANKLFAEILSDSRVQDEVDRIAGIWIDSPHRRHGGVFLAGKISGGQIAGDLYEYQLATSAGEILTLLMPEPLDPLIDGSTSPLGIVGTVVDSPADQIAGYRGTASRAIWVESAIPLE